MFSTRCALQWPQRVHWTLIHFASTSHSTLLYMVFIVHSTYKNFVQEPHCLSSKSQMKNRWDTMFSLISCESSMHQACSMLLLSLMYNTRLQSLRQVPCQWMLHTLEQLEQWVTVSTILRRMQWKVGSITANAKRQTKAATHHEALHLQRRAGRSTNSKKGKNRKNCDAETAILGIGLILCYLDSSLILMAFLLLQWSLCRLHALILTV